MTERTAWELFDALCDQFSTMDLAATISGGTDAAWACELRVTVNPNDRDRPDRSLVLFTAGHATGADALAATLRELDADQVQQLRETLPDELRRWDELTRDDHLRAVADDIRREFDE